MFNYRPQIKQNSTYISIIDWYFKIYYLYLYFWYFFRNSTGPQKKTSRYRALWSGGQKQKTKQKNFLCTFKDQFKPIFFVSGPGRQKKFFLILNSLVLWSKMQKTKKKFLLKLIEKAQPRVLNQTVNITITSAARRSQALKRLRRYQLLIHIWIGRLSANIANLSIGLTAWRPIIQKLTEESISSNW